jgi:hypothetical protein
MTERITQPRSRQFLTYSQMGVRWNCSPRTVKRKAERGEIEIVYLGERMPRIPEDEAVRYEQERMRPAKVGGAS